MIALMAAPTAIDWWQGRGANQQMEESMEGQKEISDAQLDLQKKYADIDIPFKGSLYNAMSNRSQRKMPRFLQRSFTPTNPYANVRRVAPSLGMLQKNTPQSGANMAPAQSSFKNPLIANAIRNQLQGASGGFLKQSQAPQAIANPIVGRGRYGALMPQQGAPPRRMTPTSASYQQGRA